MRKSNGCSFLKVLAIMFILMFIVNFTVLRVYFDVRLSDVALLFKGDGSFQEGGSAADVLSAESEVVGPIEGDSPTESDSPTEGDSPMADDHSLVSLLEKGDVVKLLDNLSLRDKITLAYIAARIGKDELSRFTGITEDGITADEIIDLREYAGERLDPSDIEALEDIFYRNQHLYSEVLR